MAKIRVTRTLVYEGSPEWIRETMAHAVCGPSEPFRVVGNTITEIDRKEEVIEEVTEKLSESELKEERT